MSSKFRDIALDMQKTKENECGATFLDAVGPKQA